MLPSLLVVAAGAPSERGAFALAEMYISFSARFLEGFACLDLFRDPRKRWSAGAVGRALVASPRGIQANATNASPTMSRPTQPCLSRCALLKQARKGRHRPADPHDTSSSQDSSNTPTRVSSVLRIKPLLRALRETEFLLLAGARSTRAMIRVASRRACGASLSSANNVLRFAPMPHSKLSCTT